MDVFKEFIVKKELTTNEKTSRLLIILACIALAFAFIIFTLGTIIQLFGILFAALSVYFGWKLITRYFVEYEYIITNADLDIDKITNQSSRKRLCTIDLHKVSEFGKYKSEMDIPDDLTIIQASANNSELEDYYLYFNHREHGSSMLIFTPSVEVVDLIKPFIPHTATVKV